jgi:ABC-type transport system involved in cytochrome c biogenesis permease subunit
VLVVVSEMTAASWSFYVLFAIDVSCCLCVGLTVFCVDLAGASGLKFFYILRQIIFSMWKTLQDVAERCRTLGFPMSRFSSIVLGSVRSNSE